MIICPVGAELLLADGWLDGQTEPLVAFRSFVNKTKNHMK